MKLGSVNSPLNGLVTNRNNFIQVEMADSNTSPVKINWNDATWILTSSFIIFTMQTGFSLLQSGFVRKKNQVSIMFKTTFDPIICGLTYWFIAYGFTEESDYSNRFIGVGSFLVDSVDSNMGQLFASFTYKLSIMSTVTNIILGAMAERIDFIMYFIFATLISVAFSISNYWIQSPGGFLHYLGAVDIAGCSVIHLAGGTSGLVATQMLKPREGRFNNPSVSFKMSDPTNALLGTYMLWWGWVGFHMSSTFGVSNNRWLYCSRSAVCTILSSSIGGITGIVLSFIFYKKQINIKLFIAGLLSGLVSISGGCTQFSSGCAFFVGFFGALLSIATIPILKYLQIDDPMNSIAIHLVSSIWGMIAVGLFIEQDSLFEITYNGLFKDGDFTLLGVQLFSIIVIMSWSALVTYLILRSINKYIPIRISEEREKIGLDLSMNNITTNFDVDSILSTKFDIISVSKSAAAKRSKHRLKHITRAIMAVNRFMQLVPNKFKHETKSFNTKLLAQSWSAIPPLANESPCTTTVEVKTTFHPNRPMYTRPHE